MSKDLYMCCKNIYIYIYIVLFGIWWKPTCTLNRRMGQCVYDHKIVSHIRQFKIICPI